MEGTLGLFRLFIAGLSTLLNDDGSPTMIKHYCDDIEYYDEILIKWSDKLTVDVPLVTHS